jgi:hypothetical protein
MMANWNKAKIADLLRRNDRAVERAMVVLYDRQTSDEKAVSDTRHTNQRGFSCFHAKSGSYYARWCIKGNRLTDEANGRVMIKAIEKPKMTVHDALTKAGVFHLCEEMGCFS